MKWSKNTLDKNFLLYLTNCPYLFDSKFIVSLAVIFTKINMVLSYSIPILQLIGLCGCSWSILIVLKSNNISFIKTKYFYTAVFVADIVANVSMFGFDKFLLFLKGFRNDFSTEQLITRYDIVCKFTRYKYCNYLNFGIN